MDRSGGALLITHPGGKDRLVRGDTTCKRWLVGKGDGRKKSGYSCRQRKSPFGGDGVRRPSSTEKK